MVRQEEKKKIEKQKKKEKQKFEKLTKARVKFEKYINHFNTETKEHLRKTFFPDSNTETLNELIYTLTEKEIKELKPKIEDEISFLKESKRVVGLHTGYGKNPIIEEAHEYDVDNAEFEGNKFTHHKYPDSKVEANLIFDNMVCDECSKKGIKHTIFQNKQRDFECNVCGLIWVEPELKYTPRKIKRRKRVIDFSKEQKFLNKQMKIAFRGHNRR